MKKLKWQIVLGVFLVILAASVYWLQIAIFKDIRSTFYYMVQDFAFVPFEVLLVTVIVNRLLIMREKRAMMKKMNMVIGAFFSEVGTDLLRVFMEFDEQRERIREQLTAVKDWPVKKFPVIVRNIKTLEYEISSKAGNLETLRSFLLKRRNFLLRLLENPNLLEQETFTELLWAVFHLTDELGHRKNISELPLSDHEHLSGDIKRAYALLLAEWVAYLSHLKQDYPYLYSLALRTNPFDLSATPVVS